MAVGEASPNDVGHSAGRSAGRSAREQIFDCVRMPCYVPAHCTENITPKLATAGAAPACSCLRARPHAAHRKMAEAETAPISAPVATYGEMDFPEERKAELKAAFDKVAKEGRVEHKEVCPSVPALQWVAPLTDRGCRRATGSYAHVHRRGAQGIRLRHLRGGPQGDQRRVLRQGRHGLGRSGEVRSPPAKASATASMACPVTSLCAAALPWPVPT